LPDDEAARAEANLTACDLRAVPGEDWSEWIIEVTDEKGRHVVALPIGNRAADDLMRRVTSFRFWKHE
jgi:hypothetical protein